MQPLAVAVLISGSGTTLRNLIEQQQTNGLPVDFRCVISSRHDAPGLDFARSANIPLHVIRKRDFIDAASHSRAVFDAVRASGARLVIMAGYLEHVLIPEDFENRVLNIHPSLIPAFSGHGMYGLRVHTAVLEHGVKQTGCTVHFVDNQYDHGPIVLQRTCEVASDDTPEALQKRVFAVECEALPEAIRQIAVAWQSHAEEEKRSSRI